jgi:hypothetical protein
MWVDMEVLRELELSRSITKDYSNDWGFSGDIIIGGDVDDVNIIGIFNHTFNHTRIIIDSKRTTALALTFNNFSQIAPIGQVAIFSNNNNIAVDITFIGENLIQGGSADQNTHGASGSDGIRVGGNLSIQSTGRTIIQGGAGGQGAWGSGVGGRGGIGIYAGGNVSLANLTVRGGSGGNGGQGNTSQPGGLGGSGGLAIVYGGEATLVSVVRTNGQNGSQGPHGATPPPPSCVADGTLITLADGSQIAVENLTGDELLLVWNFHTGAFEAMPIMFIDSDPRGYFEVAQLFFENGKYVKIIDAHGFWSATQNKYVRITVCSAYQYIGEYFLKHIVDDYGTLQIGKSRLVDVVVFKHYTATWNPITPTHMAFFANGVLTSPGVFVNVGFHNIFEVDEGTLSFCQYSYLYHVEKYGLMTFDEFQKVMPDLPEVFFHAFNGQYLKIAFATGQITIEDLFYFAEKYAEFLVL